MDTNSILLTGKTAIVTGAGRGLGEAIATAFADFGAKLAICDRDADLIADVGDRLSKVTKVVVGAIDVRNSESTAAFVEEAVSTLGALDVLVNNAGGTFYSSFLDISEKGEDTLIAENFTQITRLTRRVVPHMPSGGSVINITSTDAHQGAPGVAIYGAMKAAITNLSMALALEFAPRGIRVNALAPCNIPTGGQDSVFDEIKASGNPFISTIVPPGGRMGRPEELAAIAVFLASDMSSWVTGNAIIADGGVTAGGAWHLQGSCPMLPSGTVPLLDRD